MARKRQKGSRASRGGSGARTAEKRRPRETERARVLRLEAELQAAKRALRHERERIRAERKKRSSLKAEAKPRKSKKKAQPAKKRPSGPKARVAAPQVPRVRGAQPRSGKPKPKPKRRPRDEKGRFISGREKRKQEALKKVEREFEKGRHEEEKQRAKVYPITADVFRRLTKTVKAAAAGIEASNFDLTATLMEESYGASFDATVEVEGLGEIDLADMRERVNKEDRIVQAILAALEALTKSRVKKGFQVQLQLRPTETVMLEYGRDKPLMTTRWMNMDDPDEVGKLVVRARQLLDSLARNQWDVTKIKLGFHYDREVALGGT